MEGGAGLLQAADAGALAAEAAGAPAWVGAAQALGASDGLIAFLADEGGAVNPNVLFGLGGEEEAVAAGADPVQAAQSGLDGAVGGAEVVAEQTAAAGDAADAGRLAEAEVGAARTEAADLAAGAEPAAAADAAAAEVGQAQQACLAQEGSPGGCFAAGVPLLTPDGGKPIESFQENDRLFSRNESDPNGPPIVGTVEKVFVRMARILEIRLEGQVIGTTAEHRFWVEARKAWTAAGEIRPGDRLLSQDGRRVAVEALEDTGRVETVYNLRVAEHHTYFVGGLSWGFAVWRTTPTTPPSSPPTRRPIIRGATRPASKTRPRCGNCISTRRCAATCPPRCPTDRSSRSPIGKGQKG